MRRLRRLGSIGAVLVLLVGCGSGSSARSHASGARHSGPRGAVAASRHPSPTALAIVRNATPQPDWKPDTGPVPILVYHDLGTPPPTENYPGLYVSDDDFIAEMQWLDQHGYQAVTLDEMMNSWFHGGTLPSKPIVITFDNGYIPQATFAPSVMSRYGWPGVLNEITADHLSDARIRRLLAIGWEVDSHSVSHPDLTTISASALRYQVVASRAFLQHTFHIRANSFCYPSSRYNAAVIAAVRAAGYTNAVTEVSGYATRSDPFLLDRFEIEGGVTELAADLER